MHEPSKARTSSRPFFEADGRAGSVQTTHHQKHPEAMGSEAKAAAEHPGGGSANETQAQARAAGLGAKDKDANGMTQAYWQNQSDLVRATTKAAGHRTMARLKLEHERALDEYAQP